MQSPSWYVHRLRSMTVAEVLWRIRGMAIANLDLIRIPLGLTPGVRHLPTRIAPGFDCCPAATEFRVKRHTAPFDRWSQRLLTQAEKILANKLSLFDLEDRYVGDPVDWHRDFSSSKAAPVKLSNLIDYRDFDAVGDCKLVWEPNRHHQLVVLARAWQVSRDRRFACKVVSLLDSWMAANPFGYGMNWKSPLEIGIRLINWVWAIDLIRDAEVADDDWNGKLMEKVHLSVWEIQRKYSRGSSANNHLIGEAAGVFIACCYFSELPDSRNRRRVAQTILEREILNQSFADGCGREHALGYQFFVIQFFTLSLLAGQRAGAPFSPQYRERLQRMYEFMADVCADTGRAPDFGDADDGYVLDLGERPCDASRLLTVGARLFGDCAVEDVVDSETAFWLLGFASAKTGPARLKRTSRAYQESGYFILRSGSDCGPSGESVRVFFDCAELGFGSIAAHGHADCLSFSLAVDGQDVLVDPGTYDYFTHPDWRNYFRSTMAHNTVCIDGLWQSESLGPFLWGRRANARVLEWVDSDSLSRISGEHDGYARLSDAVMHRRTLTLHKHIECVEILDTITAAQPHKVSVCFHVAPECAVTAQEDGGVLVENRGVRMRLTSSHGALQARKASDFDCRGWISAGYHRRQAGHFISLDTQSSGNTEIVTRIDISRGLERP